ncbi:MAG: hypothetical protein HY814_01365 [Candidatus Riflebacteria bacterium]|nr:hypothetical protein [Candidatus Riflebacteria bacterium]
MSQNILSLAGLLLVASITCSALEAADGQPATPRTTATAKQLVGYIQKHPDDLGALVELGKVQLRTHHPQDAVACFEAARKRGHEEPRLACLLALAYRDAGDKARAVAVLQEHLRLRRDDADARELLSQLQGTDCPPVEVSDLETFNRIAYYEACYDAQHRATVALARYNLQKGTDVKLVDYNWKTIVEDLHTYGYADSPIEEPGGKGMLLSDDGGRVFCSVHLAAPAPCAEGTRPARMQRARVAGAVLVQAAKTRDPILAFAAVRLAARGLRPEGRELALAVLAAPFDAKVRARLLPLAVAAVPSDLRRDLVPALERALSDASPLVRAEAQRALAELGSEPGKRTESPR